LAASGYPLESTVLSTPSSASWGWGLIFLNSFAEKFGGKNWQFYQKAPISCKLWIMKQFQPEIGWNIFGHFGLPQCWNLFYPNIFFNFMTLCPNSTQNWSLNRLLAVQFPTKTFEATGLQRLNYWPGPNPTQHDFLYWLHKFLKVKIIKTMRVTNICNYKYLSYKYL
jgi:hypothetical protein